jgi:hypothetical protein
MAMVGHSISDCQATIEAALAALSRFQGGLLPSALAGLAELAAPPDMVPRVFLCKPTGRRFRYDANSSNFRPEAGCKVEILYEQSDSAGHQSGPSTEDLPTIVGGNGSTVRPSEPAPEDHDHSEFDLRVQQIVVALESAERDQRWFKNFVALTTFRDKYLPTQGYAWAQEQSERQSALARAIEQGLVLTSRVANPKSPEHPVTAIRLNRSNLAVQQALESASAQQSPFAPIPIRGEPLSDTVIRERR